MIPADERYRHDIKFKQLVDSMYAMIAQLDYTPTEIREAAMLAQIKYEMYHPRPICVSQDVLEALQAKRDERTRNAEQPKTWECDGCNQKWPNYQSWHDHNCPPKQVTQDAEKETK